MIFRASCFRLIRMSLFSYHVRRVVGVSLFIVITYALILTLRPQPEIMTDRVAQLKHIAKVIQSGHASQKLWAGGQACKHPHLDVNNPEMMKFVKPQKPIECNPEEDWVKVRGSTAYITPEAIKLHGDIECSFTDILRTNDFSTHTGLTTTTHTEYNLESSDFTRVRCAADDGQRWSSTIAGVRHDQDVLDRTGWHLLPPQAIPLNVLIFGFDSLSRNTFIRKLPKSHEYLRNDLNAIVLEGYNIVGDGTPQALIPILTGKTELELPDTRKRMGSKAVYVNVYPFIWNNFRDNGYVTAYMEDTPSVGIFTYRLKGFNNEPTDHYMRPFFVDAEPDFSRHYKYCIGSIPRHKIMLDYARHMYTVYKDRPKFIFGFHGEISHDSYNLVGAADGDFLSWLTWFKSEGHLNNTLLIVMSDHGHRFADVRNTQQGKLEERLPWFSFVLPQWFELKYPTAAVNIRTNAKRLTTPFDIHATLYSILHRPDGGFRAPADLSQRSISLFREVPRARTCPDAFIEPHWCACLDWERIDEGDSIVQKAAMSFVEFLNKYNSEFSDLCEQMSLREVLWAARLLPSNALRKFQQSADVDGFVPDMGADLEITLIVYQLKVATSPGPAVFEVSVTYHLNTENFTFKISDVSRINKYGRQAKCIEDTQEHLRKYCYCKGT